MHPKRSHTRRNYGQLTRFPRVLKKSWYVSVSFLRPEKSVERAMSFNVFKFRLGNLRKFLNRIFLKVGEVELRRMYHTAYSCSHFGLIYTFSYFSFSH